ncbi:MAG: substrate-binding domain-containing protein [Candidatus Bathyarchaeota archaeon]|nr:substrate-binding domain-containing protein [Candidatus Bathyarchaeota archaeon]
MAYSNKKGLTKIYAAIIVTIIIVASVVGVVYWQMTTPSQSTDEPLVLGISMHTLGTSWHTALLEYLEWFAEDLGMETIVTNAEYDPALQIQQVDYLISSGIDGLVWVASDTEAAAGVATRCKEAGVPNVEFNEDCNTPDIDLTITVGYQRIASLMTKAMVAEMAEQHGEVSGVVFEIYGGLETPFTALMHAGFDEIMSQYPDVTVVSYDVNWDDATCQQKTSEMIDAHGKPVAIFGGGSGPLANAALAALKAADMAYTVGDPNHVILVGDCTADFLATMEEGYGDIGYTEVEQYYAALPVYYCWQMMKNGVDSVKAELPPVGSDLYPENIPDDLVALSQERYGVNPLEGIQWWPAAMSEYCGHLRISMAGSLITIDGTIKGVTADEIGVVAYNDPSLYANQAKLMEANGFGGF